jgi:hypothetical protein
MNFRDKITAINEHRVEIQRLQADLDARRIKALATLPREFGYVDMQSLIAAVRVACGEPAARHPRSYRRRIEPVKQPTLVPSESPPVEHPSPSKPEPSAHQAATPTRVLIGTNLETPASFGLLPDVTLLDAERIKVNPTLKADLSRALVFAAKVLHTSKVPAAIWRAWRAFEQDGAKLLRVD